MQYSDHHFCKEWGAGAVSGDLLNRHLKRGAHSPGHVVHVSHAQSIIKYIQIGFFLPQTDGLVDHLNKTLKSMIHKFIPEDECSGIAV